MAYQCLTPRSKSRPGRLCGESPADDLEVQLLTSVSRALLDVDKKFQALDNKIDSVFNGINLVREEVKTIKEAAPPKDKDSDTSSAVALVDMGKSVETINRMREEQANFLTRISEQVGRPQPAAGPEEKAGALRGNDPQWTEELRQELTVVQDHLLKKMEIQQESLLLQLRQLTTSSSPSIPRTPTGTPRQAEMPVKDSTAPWQGETKDSPAIQAIPVTTPVAAQLAAGTKATADVKEPAAPDKAKLDTSTPHFAADLDVDPDKVELKTNSSLAAVFFFDHDVDKPTYTVEDQYHEHGLAQKIARASWFNHLTVFVVCVNAVYIGVESDHNEAENIYDADAGFQLFSQFFCIYFTWELVVRFIAFRDKWQSLKDGWFRFDLFLVIMMILDMWVLMILLKTMEGESNVHAVPTQPLRMLRLAKLTRMARLMKAFPELVTMVKAMVRSLRAILSSLILIMLMTYIWAILLHMLLKDDDETNSLFMEELGMDLTTIGNCMWSLLMDGTLLLDSPIIITVLIYSGDFLKIVAGFSFLLYSLLSALLVLQMLIGVLVDVVSQITQDERDAADVGLVKQELLMDLEEFGGDDRKISRDELYAVMNNPKSRALLKRLKINRLFLMELQKLMFPSQESVVPIATVLDMMLMCRGDNKATIEALASGFCYLAQEVKEQREAVAGFLRDAMVVLQETRLGVIGDQMLSSSDNEVLDTLRAEGEAGQLDGAPTGLAGAGGAHTGVATGHHLA